MLQPDPFQPQAVRHDAYAAHGHGRPGYHRVEQEAAKGVENPGGYGYSYYIIDESPEQVLPDGAHGACGQPYGIRNLGRVGTAMDTAQKM